MIRCSVKIRTTKALYQYAGIFESTWHAMMDAAKRVSEPCCVTVEVVK